MHTRYWALGGGRQGGQAPKPKGLTRYPAIGGVGQPPGSGATMVVELEGASPRAPRWAPDVRKHHRKKKPPLRTIDEGIHWAVALGQNCWGRVSKETKGICEV